MSSTGWEARLFYGLALWFANVVHPALVGDQSNTPEGMFIYHGVAALTDCLLLILASYTLRGSLSDSMQDMCLLAMVINFCGWLAYLAYAPPITYNYAIGWLGYVQFGRLLWVDHHGLDRLRDHFVCGPNIRGAPLHYEKAER